jgi:hypothetical protein
VKKPLTISEIDSFNQDRGVIQKVVAGFGITYYGAYGGTAHKYYYSANRGTPHAHGP